MLLEIVKVSGLPSVKSIDISISAEEAVRTASVDVVIVGPYVDYVGKPVVITASGDPVLTGYVRDANPAYDADGRSLSVSLVSRTIDYVECSADHKTGEILKKDLAEIAKELDTHGVGIESDAKFEREARHKLIPGESAFASIERRARGRGVLIHDTEKGRLKLATKPAGTHAGLMKRGVNILPGSSASFTEQGRFSDVKVRGQASEGTKKQQLRSEAKVKDSGVKRKRTLIMRHEGEITIDRAKKKAQWTVNRAAGNAATANLIVTGWRDAGGRLWTPNYLVSVYDDWLGLDGMMIIKAVTLSQSDGGTTATLSLADPRALGGDNPRGKSSNGYAAPGAVEAEYADE